MAKPSNSRSSGASVRPRKLVKNNANPMRAERKGWKASFRLDAVQGSFSSVKNHLSGVRSRASKILVGARRTRAAVSAKDRLTRLSNLPLKPPQIIRWDLLGVSMSYLWGMLHRRTLPTILRKPMYKLWAYTTKCNLEEMKHPLESYPSMCAFFTRELKEGARLITAHGMASPVDGRVVVAGEITEDQVREVKGLTYSVSGFLGTPFEEIRRRPNTKLYHCVLYLAPGDYHRIHSPTDWSITESRHFPGTLFPIAPTVGRLIPNLLALNERVVVCGEAEEGFYSLTAVGAYNVGSIHLKFDTSVRTNVVYRDFTCANLRYFSFGGVGSYAYSKAYSKPFEVAKGDEIGHFNLGSTVVLIFESEEFEFKVRPGDYIQMGSQLGVSYNTQPLTESTSGSAL